MELNLYHLPDDVFHTPRFLGQDTGVMNLYVVTKFYAIFGHSSFSCVV